VSRLTLVKIGAWICGLLTATFVIGVLSLVLCGGAQAQERYSDPDKKLHALAGASIAGATTIYTKSAASGFTAGCAVGIAKEAYDSISPKHTATVKDAIATCLGAGLGAATGFLVTPNAVFWQIKF
jgi:VanZ family protein